MQKRNKIYGIDIIRILACMCVYTQHYFGMELEESQPAFNAFRDSPWFKSIFGIFAGQLVLIAFFIISGFFISYYHRAGDSADRPKVLKKCIYKSLNIIIPTMAVIVLTALSSGVLKVMGLSDMLNLKELGLDTVKLIFGLPGDKHIYYGYPLWSQHFFFLGYIFGYAFLFFFGYDDRAKYIAYVCVLIYSLLNSEYMYFIFCGMFAGELCKGSAGERIHVFLKNKAVCIASMLVIMSVMAYVYNLDYDRIQIYGPAGFFLLLLVVVVYNLSMDGSADGGEGPDKRKRTLHGIIDWFAANTYACYLLHFFIFCAVMKPLHRLTLKLPHFWDNNTAACLIMYIMLTVILWAASYVFTRYVLTPMKKLYDIIWKGLSRHISEQ